MKTSSTNELRLAADEAGVVTWAHIGDLHVTTAGGESVAALRDIVATIGRSFTRDIAFVYLPGDTANEGRPEQYSIVRDALSPLRVPWIAAVGDHDMHEGTPGPFARGLSGELVQAFDAGHLRCLKLDVFDDGDDPRAFAVGNAQLDWLEHELRTAAIVPAAPVAVFAHCYPTDLVADARAARLAKLIREFDVRIFEMGHTHYNELSNDGHTLFVATRSTGQIEEGPVGFSVTNIDGDAVSWRFFELGAFPAVVITSPADERLERDRAPGVARDETSLLVRCKAWSDRPVVAARATLGHHGVDLVRVGTSAVWQGRISIEPQLVDATALTVSVHDQAGRIGRDAIRIASEGRARPRRRARDHENALEAWPEHGLLGTQLGPNRNGRQW